MESKWTIGVILLIIGLIIGIPAGYFMIPPKVVTQTRTVYKNQTQIVYKNVTVTVPKLVIPNIMISYSNAIPPPPEENLTGFSNIGPSFYTNESLDALLYAAKYETNPAVRTKLYNIIQQISNYEVPLIWLGQVKARRHYWSWINLPPFNPVLADNMWNFITKDPNGLRPTKMVVLDIGEPESLDPAQTYETAGWGDGEQLYNRLVFYYGNDSVNLVPELAYAWAMSPDGTKLYFAIRDGITFYDPWDNKTFSLTPDDVAYSINRIVQSANYKKVDYPEWILSNFVKSAHVVTSDEMNKELASGLSAPVLGEAYPVSSMNDWINLFKTKFSYVSWHTAKTNIAGYVEVDLYKPYLAIMQCLGTNVGSIISKQAVALHNSTTDPLALKWYNEHPVGTGAYYLVSWTHNQELIFKTNPYYWGLPKPTVKEFDIKIVPSEDSRIMALQKGDGDYGVVAPTSESKMVGVTLTYNGKTWKFEMPWVGGTFDIVHVYLNYLRKPFNNVYVRQALAWATPYEFIISQVYRGHLMPVSGVIPKGMLGYTDNVPVDYWKNWTEEERITHAKALLQKSGIDPTQYTITIYYNQGNKAREMIATLLQTEWQKLGFTVKIQTFSWPTYLQKLTHHDYDVAILGWAPDYADPDDYAYPLLWGGYHFKDLKLTSTMPSEAVTITVGNTTIVIGKSPTKLPSYAILLAIPALLSELAYALSWSKRRRKLNN